MRDIANQIANERRKASIVERPIELKNNRAVSGYISSPDIIELNKQDLDRISEEGYRRNPIVKACIRRIANVASTFPIITVKENGNKWERLYGHDAEKLLNKPNGNNEFGRTALLYSFAADYVNAGFSVMQIYKPSSGDMRNTPKYLYPLRASKVEIKTGTPQRPVEGIIFRDRSLVEFDIKEVLFVKNWNPTDYWFGASDTWDNGHLIDLFNMQVLWNSSLLKNKGVPPYYLYSDSYVTKEQAEEISKLATDMINGYQNSGKAWVQHSGLQLKQLGFNASDIDWREGMWMIAKLICVGYGVPPSLILGEEGTTDRKSDEKAFYLETMIPMMQTFLDAFNNKVMPMIDDDPSVKLVIDKDQIMALREDIDRMHNRVRADYMSGVITRNEARDEIDFEPTETDRIVEPVNVSQVGDNIASQTEKEKPLVETEKLPNQKG